MVYVFESDLYMGKLGGLKSKKAIKYWSGKVWVKEKDREIDSSENKGHDI